MLGSPRLFFFFFSLRNFNAEHSDWTDSTKLIIKSSHKIKEKKIVREKVLII